MIRMPGIQKEQSGNQILFLLFLVVVFGPVCFLAGMTALYFTGNAGDAIALVFPVGRRFDLFITSITLAGMTAAGGTVIGILAGSFLWELRTGLWSKMWWFAVMLVPVPAFLYAQAWMTLFAWFNVPGSLPPWVLCYWVQLGAFSPIGIVLGMLAMASVDTPPIEAARLLYPDIQVFRRIVLPIAAPALGACAGLLFLLSITDYSVSSLFSQNVYALEIFSEFSASNEPARAMLLAMPLLAVTMGVMLLSQGRMRNLMMGTSLFQRRPEPPLYPGWFVALQYAALGLVLLHSIVLVGTLVIDAAMMSAPIRTVVDAGSCISTTFLIALAAALVSLPLAYSMAAEMARPGRRARIWWLLCIAPLAIPAPLVGIGLIGIWNHPSIAYIYGTIAMPVLAALARFTPIAALILLAQLRHIDPLLTDAARVFQTSAIDSWIRIRLPLLSPGLLAAACMVFAFTAGELGATLLVIPPGVETVTLRVYNYLHYGSSGAVAALGLGMMVLMLLTGGVAVSVIRGWAHILGGRSTETGVGGSSD